jgi:hypothetical protein
VTRGDKNQSPLSGGTNKAASFDWRVKDISII